MSAGKEWLIQYGIKGLIFIALVVSMYFFICILQKAKPLQRAQKVLEDWDRQRILSLGMEKKDFFERWLDRLDEQLTQAGLKRYVPKATVELFVVFNLVEFTLVFWLAGEGIFLPFAAGCFAVYLNKLMIDLLRYKNKKITENHLLELLNFISDYAITENEITMILYLTGQRMPNPLRRELVACHVSAGNTGDSEKALYELRRSIDHPLFQEIILLLELCSRSSNDYQKVIQGCRGMVNRYLKEEKEKAEVIKALVAEAGIMVAIAGYGIHTLIKEFASDIGYGNSMAEFFLQTPVGVVSMTVFAMLIFAMVQVILKFSKR